MASGALPTSDHETRKFWSLLVIQLSNKEYTHVVYSLPEMLYFAPLGDRGLRNQTISEAKRQVQTLFHAFIGVNYQKSKWDILKNGSFT